MEGEHGFSRRWPVLMVLLIVTWCVVEGHRLPRWFIWTSNAGFLCFALSWLTFGRAAAGERAGESTRRCAACGEARLVTPADCCPECGSERLALPLINRLSLIFLTICVLLPHISLAQIGGGGDIVRWLNHAFLIMILVGPLAFVFWKGRVEQRVPHGPQIESLLTSSELAVPVSFFLAGMGILMAGVLVLMGFRMF